MMMLPLVCQMMMFPLLDVSTIPAIVQQSAYQKAVTRQVQWGAKSAVRIGELDCAVFPVSVRF
jgi:hypothetical protein